MPWQAEPDRRAARRFQRHRVPVPGFSNAIPIMQPKITNDTPLPLHTTVSISSPTERPSASSMCPVPSHPALSPRGTPSPDTTRDSAGRLPTGAAFRLMQAQMHKVQVQQVAKLYEDTKKAALRGCDIHSPAIQSELFAGAQRDGISKRFSAGEPALVRSLKFSDEEECSKPFGNSGKTPAKREADNMADKVSGRDIVIQATSVVAAPVKANIMSFVKSYRPECHGLPSLVALPGEGGRATGLAQAWNRPGFGDIHTLRSNNGFDDEYACVSPRLSHAEKVQLLEQKVRRYMKTDAGRRSSEFSHSLAELVQNMMHLQATRPESTLRHNEFCTRMELWDVQAMEIGKSPPLGIASFLDFVLEMSAMARELEHEGPDGPRLTEFLTRQMSWSETGAAKDQASTLESVKLIPADQRERLLAEILSRLREGISLCAYELTAAGAAIRPLSLRDFTAGQILAGLELFLSAKLVHPPSCEAAQLSRATIGDEPYQVDQRTPAATRQFLSQSLSNNRYESAAHLHRRAQVHLDHIEAEKKLIEAASAALLDPESPAMRQAAWMSHLERGLWRSEPAIQHMDREQLGNEALGSVVPRTGSPYFKPRTWRASSAASSAFAMMLKAEAGPFTLEQTRAAFEAVQEGDKVSRRLKIADRAAFRAENRHDAQRAQTHSSETLLGLDLSQDPGTRLRDELAAPVMTGTSGSASDVALATKFGAQRAEVSWAAPGLTEEEAKTALMDLALHFFRSEGSGPPVFLAKCMNSVRVKLGLPPKSVEAAEVFTHSYPEIHAGISLTMDGVDPRDPQAVDRAMFKSTEKAKAHLTAVASPRKRMPGGGEAGCADTLPSLQSAMSERDGGLARGL